jgi:anti-anti-sigma regulatory factor
MPEKNPMTIENALEYKRALSEVAASGKKEPFDLSGVPSIDVSGIQLLVATMRESTRAKRPLSLTGELSPGFHSTIILIGLTDKVCRTGEELELIIKAVL